jgi:hypothetical protein
MVSLDDCGGTMGGQNLMALVLEADTMAAS